MLSHGPFAFYPPTGVPFPELPEGWTYDSSRSYGHYYFTKGDDGDPTYHHPETDTMFRVTPQFYVLQTNMTPAEFVEKNRLRCRVEDVESWLKDQRLRCDTIEHEVRKALKLPSDAEIARKLCEAGDKDRKRRRSRSR